MNADLNARMACNTRRTSGESPADLAAGAGCRGSAPTPAPARGDVGPRAASRPIGEPRTGGAPVSGGTDGGSPGEAFAPRPAAPSDCEGGAAGRGSSAGVGAGFPSVATCVSRAVLCASAVPAICGPRAQVGALSFAAACWRGSAASRG